MKLFQGDKELISVGIDESLENKTRSGIQGPLDGTDLYMCRRQYSVYEQNIASGGSFRSGVQICELDLQIWPCHTQAFY